MTNVSTRSGGPILIVEDNADLAGVLAAALTDEGYAVELCFDSREAVQRVGQIQPAAVILDILMPEIDGWTILREVRRTESGRRLPVVLMSGAWRGNDQPRDIGATLQRDPTVALPKPFALYDLDSALRRLGVVPS